MSSIFAVDVGDEKTFYVFAQNEKQAMSAVSAHDYIPIAAEEAKDISFRELEHYGITPLTVQ